MKTVTSDIRTCYQGELKISWCNAPSETAAAQQPVNGTHIVGHSETGHHHVFEAANTLCFVEPDGMTAYLKFDGEHAVLEHRREHHTHEAIKFVNQGGGCLKIRKQREHSPEGWRRVQD